jgi:hypothetical protein
MSLSRSVRACGYIDNAIVHQGRLDPGLLLLTTPYRKSRLACDHNRPALGRRLDRRR